MVPGMRSKPAALRAARQRQGHTVTALAKLSGVSKQRISDLQSSAGGIMPTQAKPPGGSKQRISDLESSAVGIMPPTAKRLADALGVDIEDIADIADEAPS